MPMPALYSLLKEFEREARTDGMPAAVLAERKKAIADELNDLISKKKELGAGASKDELFAGAAVAEEEKLERACGLYKIVFLNRWVVPCTCKPTHMHLYLLLSLCLCL